MKPWKHGFTVNSSNFFKKQVSWIEFTVAKKGNPSNYTYEESLQNLTRQDQLTYQYVSKNANKTMAIVVQQYLRKYAITKWVPPWTARVVNIRKTMNILYLTNSSKGKTYIVTLIYAEKKFDILQHPA